MFGPGSPRHVRRTMQRTMALQEQRPERFWGNVTAVIAGPPHQVTVKKNGGSTITCRISASYLSLTPTVGDYVFGDAVGSDHVVIDRLSA